MRIEETFYTISLSELKQFCKMIPKESLSFDVSFHDRLEALRAQKRISELKFKFFLDAEKIYED